MRGLGHAVALNYGGAEGLIQLGHHGPGKRGRRRAQEAQFRVFNDLSIAASAGQNCLMHRRYRGVPRGFCILEPAEEAQGIKPRRAPNLTARTKRRQHRRNEPVDVEKRHHVEAAIL